MRLTADQLTQLLGKSGVNAATLKPRIKADIAWPQTRARALLSQACRSAKKILSRPSTTNPTTVSATTTPCGPILFIIPPGSPESFVEGRKREAESLRGRFQGCEEGLAFARALKDVAVREQVIRSSADIPRELRKVLEGIEVGRLTPPEITKFGIEMFAICAKKESSADNTPGKRQREKRLLPSAMSSDPSNICKRYVAARCSNTSRANATSFGADPR